MKTSIIIQISFWSLLLASSALAWRFGGRTEKAGSAIMVLGAALSLVVVSELGRRFHSLEIGLLFADFAVLAGLWALMLRSKGYWPIWACAFQLSSLVTHLAVTVASHQVVKGYAVLQGFWAYPIIIAMLLGVLSNINARKRNQQP
jgi:hypothetical protein